MSRFVRIKVACDKLLCTKVDDKVVSKFTHRREQSVTNISQIASAKKFKLHWTCNEM